MKKTRTVILKNAGEHTKIPFALSLSKCGRDFGMLIKWVGVWKPLMLRQAQHERLPHLPTDFFGVMLVIALSMGASACSPVAPWQRGTLAKPSMALEPHPMQSVFREHTHGSREAASGSSAASGGGCGCY